MRIETTAEQLLFATLRIEADSQVGTGCIINHKWAEDKEGLFLITNKHVVEGTSQGRLTFTLAEPTGWAPALGKSTQVNLSENAWKWTTHPVPNIDIAASPLGSVIEHLGDNGEYVYFRSIPTDIIPEQETLENLDAVEEVLFVGYPRGIFDRANNLPIFRKGTTATPLSVDYEARPVFLIDASVFPGSSGSPVFIYNKQFWISRDKELPRSNSTFFLGVLSSVYDYEVNGSLSFEEVTAAVKPVVRTRQMIDLGIVHKARTVVETIEHLLRQHGELPAKTSMPPQNPYCAS